MQTFLSPGEIEAFLPYMRDVARCEQSLHELSLMWRIIESSAKMNCPVEAAAMLPTMAATRESFGQLEKELVASLIEEKVRTVMTEIGTQAQYVIDIVVRNLYERTADVGFLATDRELCNYVAHPTGDRATITHRLREYHDKYTVYDEILLLDTQGAVLAHIDDGSQVTLSADPLVAQTLASDTWLETFRASDLRPGQAKALIYSRAMCHPETGAVIGVLCLCFNFEQEMAGIFATHGDASGRSNMLLLDADGRVIASADTTWMPVGTRVPTNLDAKPATVMYGGRQHLVRTLRSPGYQGYPGPSGWMGQVMMPLDVAFRSITSDGVAALDPSLVQGLLSHAASFCPPLHAIMVAARGIQRTAWNSQVMTAGQGGEAPRLQTVLEQISETGHRSNALFDQSIRQLYQTVLGSSLQDAEVTAHLLVDLLDRNLYERSDDCRWWALTPELRQALAEPDGKSPQTIHSILAYINSLYTVYTRIFVYDARGRIVASTGKDSLVMAATRVNADTLARVQALQSSQDYCVTPFEASPLYGDAPTYVYHAAIRRPGAGGSVIGGIGLVFDSTVELLNMLQGGLGGRAAMSAAFVDRQGLVLSSTSEFHRVGTRIDLPIAWRSLPRGRQASQVAIHAGQYAIMACGVSSGYREFKTSDGYVEDVIAVVFRHFGAVQEGSPSLAHPRFTLENDARLQGGLEFATFFLDGGLMAMPADCVQEAVSVSEVRSSSTSTREGQIGIIGHRAGAGSQAGSYVWVFDLSQLLTGKRSAQTDRSQVMIVRRGRHSLGLLVDDLHAVARFDPMSIVNNPVNGLGVDVLVPSLIKADRGHLLIQVLDVDRLFALLMDGSSPRGTAAQTDAGQKYSSTVVMAR